MHEKRGDYSMAMDLSRALVEYKININMVGEIPPIVMKVHGILKHL